METGNLQKLKDLVQSQADDALELSLSDNQSGFSYTGMGKHLEFLLNSRNHEINFLLSEIAKEQLKDKK